MPNVQMPDGAIVNMPDTIDPALGVRLRAYQTDHAIGAANAAANAQEHGPVQDIIDMVKAVPGGLLPALKGLLSGAGAGGPEAYIARGTHIPQTVHAVTNPTETLSSVGSALENATPQQVGKNVLAPLAVGAVGGIASKVAGLGEAAAVEHPAVANYGMSTGEGQGLAKFGAGTSGRPAVAAHNQTIADNQLGAQVGVKPGTPLGGKTTDGRPVLEAAKDPANAVYTRVEANLPTGPLSPNAAQMAANVGADDLIVRSPNTQALINAQKERLLTGNLTGKQVVDTQRALRYNGFKNRGSLDPENQALGDAQLKLSDALHQQMVDNLPPGANVSVEQLTQARQNLAQIHTLQDALKGNNIDLQNLAKTHRDNPGLLQGPMADIADLADKHPEVTRLPSDEERFHPSGFGKDVAGIDIQHPIGSGAQALFGGVLGRRALIGGKPPPVPVPGLANDLAPIQPAELPFSAPPGRAFEPHQPPLAAGSEPYQPPLGLGAPFRPVAPGTHTLSLADELAPSLQANNSDLASVMSQGVPEGTVMRRTPSEAPEFPKLGRHLTPAKRKKLGESF